MIRFFGIEKIIGDIDLCVCFASNGKAQSLADSIKVPNVFTPNPNGSNGGVYDKNNLTNEVFIPLTDFINEFHLEVFNRWGELIFESHSYDLFWTGHDDRKEVPEGRYEYLVKYQFEDMDYPVEQYGNVYLKR